MYRDIKWCYVFYDVHAPICRQSPKLGDASNSGLDGDSLPARHNESLANISCPLHMSALLPDISDNNVPYPICLWPATPFLHISVGYLLFYIAMGAHWPALRVVLSFTRGAAATRDKVRCGGMNVKTPARRFYNHSLVLSRLKNFVKVPGCTGFCVDTENAAV